MILIFDKNLFLDTNYEPKFTTECFYLTIHAIIIGINPTIQHLKQLKESLRDCKNELLQLEEAIKREKASSIPILKERIKQTMDRQEVFLIYI